jgi:hypothetical protein
MSIDVKCPKCGSELEVPLVILGHVGVLIFFGAGIAAARRG